MKSNNRFRPIWGTDWNLSRYSLNVWNLPYLPLVHSRDKQVVLSDSNRTSESELFIESVEPVHKASLNDSFTDSVPLFNSLLKIRKQKIKSTSCISVCSSHKLFVWLQMTWNIAQDSYRPLLWCFAFFLKLESFNLPCYCMENSEHYGSFSIGV